MESVTISILHEGREQSHTIRKGLGLQVLAKHTDLLEFDCREADCGICICKVTRGAENLSPQTRAEQDFLRAMHADPDERLACQCRAFGDVQIRVENFVD